MHTPHSRDILSAEDRLTSLPIARRSVLTSMGLAGAAGLLPAVPALAQSGAEQPLDAFFQNPALGAATPSPDGRFAALTVAPKGGRVRLIVLELSTRKPTVVAAPDDADIGRVWWVNDSRLVFNLYDRDVAQGTVRLASGLYAVNRDGSGYRQLARRNNFGGGHETSFMPHYDRLLPAWAEVHRPTAARTGPFIFVSTPDLSGGGGAAVVNLGRLNTETGGYEEVRLPIKAFGWLLDGQDRVRVVYSYENRREKALVWDAERNTWDTLYDHEIYTEDRISPLAWMDDGGMLVLARNKTDFRGMYRYDLKSRALDPKPILSAPGYDLSPELIRRGGRVVGARILTDAPGTVWFDPALKALQARVDALLPSTVNVLQFGARHEGSVVLVTSVSDTDPGTLSLFDEASGKLEVLGAHMRGIEPKAMGKREFVRIKARDGLEVPMSVTLPKGGGKNLPMVVVVHGGPWVRGSDWTWNAHSQFLASRGYVVLEPEFRGSSGFGTKHLRAGDKQWGLRMQDDVADAAKWAIAKGIADPKRIAILGASYGGYATLMGLLNDPDIFRCGVSYVGVTDIELMYSVDWSDFSDEWKEVGMPQRVGDRVKDAEQLARTSPIKQASRIKQPILLAYGGEDRRVPKVHGERFYAAVTKTNSQVDWVEYPEEGHGWALVKNRVDFWTRVEKFLAKHLAPV